MASVDSLHASAKDLFVNELNRLRLEVGDPPLAELVQNGQGKYSKSTLDDHLSGRRVGIPNWRLTYAYINACYKSAQATDLDVERLGTMDEWRAYWSAVRQGDRDLASPIREPERALTHRMVDHPPISEARIGIQYRGRRPVTSENKRRPPPGPGSTSFLDKAAQRFEKTLREDTWKIEESLPIDGGVLVLTSGSGRGSDFPITDDLTTIGRDSDSDVFLDNTTVSRRHAVIHRCEDDSFTLRDMGSTNGTYLNQVLVTDEVALTSGDRLQVGVFRMVFIQGTGSLADTDLVMNVDYDS